MKGTKSAEILVLPMIWEVLRLLDDFRKYDLKVNSVVITRYNGEPATKVFINKLERRNIKVYSISLFPDTLPMWIP